MKSKKRSAAGKTRARTIQDEKKRTADAAKQADPNSAEAPEGDAVFTEAELPPNEDAEPGDDVASREEIRPFGDAPEDAGAEGSGELFRLKALESELEGLRAERETERAEHHRKEDSLLRLLAERDNQMKRQIRDRELERHRFRGDILAAMLAVLDDLDRALANALATAPEEIEPDQFTEGLRLIAERMIEVLGGFGLRSIEALGEKFDPNFHEALMQVESEDYEKGLVAQEIQKGYLLDDKVLRPSKVAVAL